MMEFLQNLFDLQAEMGRNLLARMTEALLAALVAGGVMWFLAAVYSAISSRLRRSEIARCFLHLLEIGIRQGKSIEQTTVSLSRQRVRTMGIYLHLLAAHIENGLRFDQALDETPWFLPAHVNEMIKAGAEVGRLEKIVVLARQTLQEGTSRARVSVNNTVVVFSLFPIGTFFVFIVSRWVIPKLKDVAQDMIGYVPHQPQLLIDWSTGLMMGLGLIWLTFALSWMLQGSRLLKWIEPGLTSFTDFALPWRRKRVQRNFSAMLALALDAGIPERRAVELAARSTANRIFISRAQTVVDALAAGMSLPKAIGLLDETGEFTWRIRNVLQSSGKFVSALSGWHDVLEARATQQEETVSQAVSSSLVLMNGCAVGLFAASVFLLLITIIQEATLW